MDILCGGCGRTLQVDDAQRSLSCPHCAHVIDLGGDAGAPEPHVEEEFLTKAKLLLRRKMLIQCGACGERLTVKQQMAGKTATCPSCGQAITIPPQADDSTLPEEAPAPEAQPGWVADEDPDQAVTVAGDVDPEISPLVAAAAEAVGTGHPHHAPQVPMAGRAPLPSWVWPAVITFSLVITVMLGYVLMAKGPGDGNSSSLTVRNPAPGQNDPLPPVPNQTPSQAPTFFPDPPTPTPAQNPNPTQTPTPPATGGKAALESLEVRMAVVSPSGQVAPPGQCFLTVKVRLNAGIDALAASSDAATVDIGGNKLRCLGVPMASLSFRLARPVRLDVPPKQSKEQTLLFLSPPSFASAGLKIDGVGQVTLPPTQLGGLDIAPGAYGENRRVLPLTDAGPVIERLRQGPPGKLALREGGGDGPDKEFDLAIDGPGLRGKFHRGDGGLRGTLSDGRTEMPCFIRSAGDGGGLILGFPDKPAYLVFYQKS